MEKIRYNITIVDDSASKTVAGFESLNGVTVISACLNKLRCEIDSDIQEWFEAVLDENTYVSSYKEV